MVAHLLREIGPKASYGVENEFLDIRLQPNQSIPLRKRNSVVNRHTSATFAGTCGSLERPARGPSCTATGAILFDWLAMFWICDGRWMVEVRTENTFGGGLD